MSCCRRRALLIGINYVGTSNELAGCWNDVDDMHAQLLTMGYRAEDIVVMKDNDSLPPSQRTGVVSSYSPTRTNIVRELHKLVRNTRSNDKRFLHFSGHGTYTHDANNDERHDDRDEAFVPVRGGKITDDFLRAHVINRMCASSTLTILLDCCHSGTGTDLFVTYEDRSLPIDPCTNKRVRTVPDKYTRREWRDCAPRKRTSGRMTATNCVVTCISSCRDSQTSADTYLANRACGAMTSSFIRACTLNTDARRRYFNLYSLFADMSRILRCERYTQRPQISFGNQESANCFEQRRAVLLW